MRIMALPADVAGVVRPKIDPWYVCRAVRPLRVTGPAENALRRFGRPDGARRYLVLLGRLVADGAREGCMMRYSLLPSDLPVTRAARSGGDRRFRLMRLVTRHTGRQRVVGDRIDLRKAGWT